MVGVHVQGGWRTFLMHNGYVGKAFDIVGPSCCMVAIVGVGAE